MNICTYCNKEFQPKDKRFNQFCSRSCAASITNKLRGNRSEATRLKISTTLKSLYHHKPKARIRNAKKLRIKKYPLTKNCKICNNFFTVFKETRLTCSNQCAIISRSNTYKDKYKNGLTKKLGGHREGSGRGKSGYFRGYFVNSTYEAAYLMFRLDHNLPIERNYKGYAYFDPERNGNFLYYPDFIIPEGLIEIKGYKTKLDSYKLSGVKDISINILYKEDMKDIFHYVKTITGKPINLLYLLYDKSKRAFKNCINCNEQFMMLSNSQTFCSRKCSASYMGKQRKLENRMDTASITEV